MDPGGRKSANEGWDWELVPSDRLPEGLVFGFVAQLIGGGDVAAGGFEDLSGGITRAQLRRCIVNGNEKPALLPFDVHIVWVEL